MFYMILFMVKNIENDYKTELGIKTLDYGIPSNHIPRFIVKFIGENFEKLNIEQDKNKKDVSHFH